MATSADILTLPIDYPPRRWMVLFYADFYVEFLHF